MNASQGASVNMSMAARRRRRRMARVAAPPEWYQRVEQAARADLDLALTLALPGVAIVWQRREEMALRGDQLTFLARVPRRAGTDASERRAFAHDVADRIKSMRAAASRHPVLLHVGRRVRPSGEERCGVYLTAVFEPNKRTVAEAAAARAEAE